MWVPKILIPESNNEFLEAVLQKHKYFYHSDILLNVNFVLICGLTGKILVKNRDILHSKFVCYA